MPCKIMIVDDEQNIRDIISEFLSETGYSVAVAVDGVDALEKVQYEQYDLYIIDVYMPRMDGLELLVKLKELQPLAVVIVTTGFSSIEPTTRVAPTFTSSDPPESTPAPIPAAGTDSQSFTSMVFVPMLLVKTELSEGSVMVNVAWSSPVITKLPALCPPPLRTTLPVTERMP